jgi:hypothetical protein
MTTTLSEIWARLPKANKRAVIAGGILATWGVVLIVSAATIIPPLRRELSKLRPGRERAPLQAAGPPSPEAPSARPCPCPPQYDLRQLSDTPEFKRRFTEKRG